MSYKILTMTVPLSFIDNVTPLHQLWVFVFIVLRFSLEVWKPSWERRVNHLYPSPCLTFLIYGVSCIYWVLRKNSSVHSVAITRLPSLVLTASSSSPATSSIFFLPWETVSWTFLGCHYASFPTRSLGFLELFSNSLLNVFGHPSRWPTFHLAITRTI